MKHSFIDNSLQPKWHAMAPENVKPEIEYVLEEAQLKLKQIETLDKSHLSYENTLLALESATEEVENAWGKLGH